MLTTLVYFPRVLPHWPTNQVKISTAVSKEAGDKEKVSIVVGVGVERPVSTTADTSSTSADGRNEHGGCARTTTVSVVGGRGHRRPLILIAGRRAGPSPHAIANSSRQTMANIGTLTRCAIKTPLTPTYFLIRQTTHLTTIPRTHISSPKLTHNKN